MSKTAFLAQVEGAALQSKAYTEASCAAITQAVAEELNKRPTTEQVNAAVSELFTSVSDGKALIASAITDKGVATAQDASFQTMQENILAIQTGDSEITLQSLTILTPPDKTGYYYNGLFAETFDPAGMTFEAVLEAFGVALTIPVGMEYIILSPGGPLDETVTQITASFRFGSQAVTANQPITVSYGSPKWKDIEQVDRTWAEFEEEFDTWAGVETA